MRNLKRLYKYFLCLFMIASHLLYSNIENVFTEMNTNGDVVSVWQNDFYAGNFEIEASILPVTGSWSTLSTISSGSGGVNALYPKVAINNSSNIVAIWSAYNTAIFSYSLYGATWDAINGWSAPAQVSTNNEHVFSNYQVKLSDTNDVVIVWNGISLLTYISVVRSVVGSFGSISGGVWPSPTTVSP